MLRPILLAGLALAAPADRSLGIASFDRLRVTGAMDVRVTAGGPTRARLTGDPRVLDGMDVRVDGTTLIVRRRDKSTAPVALTLSVPTLMSASLIGSGSVRIDGMAAARASLSVTGGGTMTVYRIAADAMDAAVIGDGRITLSGRSGQVRLLSNGLGGIDAHALKADDLTVRLDGTGEVSGQARYTAIVYASGGGRVGVAGKPKCTIRAPAGSRVTCGAP